MPLYPPASSGAPTYAPANLKNRYDPINCVYNWKASNTRILQQGLANAKAGGNTTHLVMGDSTSDGGYAGQPAPTYDRLRVWSVAMRDSLALMGIPETGNGGVKVCDGGLVDSRFVLNGSWTLTSNYFATSSTVGNTATFTAERSASVVEVWYYDGFTANFTVTVAGAVVGTIVPGGTAVWLRRRFTGLTVVVGTTVVVTITVAGTGLVLAGVKTFTPGGGFILDNLAQSASTATGTGGGSWLDTTVTSGLGGAYQNLSGRTRQVTDGVTTAASATFGSATAVFTLQDVGEPIDFPPPASGAGAPFPANTYIAAWISATQVTMSAPAVVTASAVTANISRDPACIHIALGINDVASQSAATITGAITTIRNRFPKSDCILHLQHEQNYAVVAQATQQLLQSAMYSLADTLDVPLYDWRDRVGSVATGWANGAYGDYALHLTPATSLTLGSILAGLMVGGPAHPQSNVTPVYDTDLTQKSYVDRITAQQTGWRNLLHNGSMDIQQRSVSNGAAAVTAIQVDRWQVYNAVGGAGTVTASQDTTSPAPGFPTSLKLLVGTADTALGTTHRYAIQQSIEGVDLRRLGWGTASAKAVTLSFWFKTSVTSAVFSVNAHTSGRSFVSTFTSSGTANTWQFVTINIPGDTAAALTYDASAQLVVGVQLAAASPPFGTSTFNSWQAAGNLYISSTATNPFMGVANNTLNITGVQLEVGSVATPYEWRPYQTELALCQRYFYQLTATVAGQVLAQGTSASTTTIYADTIFPVTMRAAPVASQGGSTLNLSDRASTVAVTAFGGQLIPSPYGTDMQFTCTTALGGAFRPVFVQASAASSFLAFTAEI